MIKQTLKYISLATLLISSNLQASKDFLQEPYAQRCINHVRMTEEQRIKPQWLLTYLVLAHNLETPITEALEHTGLPLHQPSHEDVVAFLNGIKAYQNANHGWNLNLGLRDYFNDPLNRMASSFRPDCTFPTNTLRNRLGFPPLLLCLTKLEALDLVNDHPTDVSPLAAFTRLTKLSLSHNKLTDVSPLATLISLTYLDLDGNQLKDISPLTTLTGLTKLDLSHNHISDVSPLAGLTKLTALYLSYNRLTHLIPLTSLTGLNVLWLNDNKITDVSPLEPLTDLTKLELEVNKVTDVSPLATLTKLRKLSISYNKRTDIRGLMGLKELPGLSLKKGPVYSM